MKLSKILLKNTFFSGIAFFLRFVFNTFVIILIGRKLSVSDFGIFTSSQSFIAIFAVLTDWGISTYLTREIAAKNKNLLKDFPVILLFKVLLSFLSISIVYVVSIWMNYDSVMRNVVMFLMIAAATDSFNNVYKGAFRGLEKLEYEALFTGISAFLLLVFVFFALMIKDDVIFIAQIFLLSRIISFIFIFLISSKIINLYISKRIKIKNILIILKNSFPYGIHMLLGLLYFNIDTILLKSIKGDYEVGLYQAAIRLLMIGLIIIEILQNAFLPTLSRLFVESKAEMIKFSIKLNKYLWIAGSFLSIILFTNAKGIIYIVFGNKYEASVNILELIAVIVFLRSIGTAYATLLTVAGKQNWRMYITFGAAIFHSTLSFILISRSGYFGAAYAAITINLLLLITYIVVYYRIIQNLLLDIYILKIFIYSIFFGAFSLLFRNISFVFSAPILLFVFIVVVYFLFLDDEERNFFLKTTDSFR